MITPTHWGNIHKRTKKIGICLLPFYIYLVAKKADYRYGMAEYYDSFIKDMKIEKRYITKEFETWCGDQAAHYYECSH